MIRHEGRLQPFSRDNLFMSIYDSLRHRRTALDDATALSSTVLRKLYPLIKKARLERKDIVETAAQTLDKFDKVAATHYRAFHPASK